MHRRRVLRWALLLHDVSKPETFAVREDGRPTFHGHEVLGARRAQVVLERLRLPREPRRRIYRLIRNHLRPSQLAESGALSPPNAAPPGGYVELEARADLICVVSSCPYDLGARDGWEINAPGGPTEIVIELH